MIYDFKDDPYFVIRNEEAVTPGELVSLYKQYGTVTKQSGKLNGAGVEDPWNDQIYYELVKVNRDGLFKGDETGEMFWHNASNNRTGAEDIVAMYMHQNADKGGETLFSDAKKAYDDLEDSVKELCDKVQSKILKMSKQKYDYFSFGVEHYRDMDGLAPHEKHVTRKPLVTIHPKNGNKGLNFPYECIYGFEGEGITKQEGKDLYFHLKEHVLQDKYIYKHEWEQYDIVLSDQHHSLHKRESYSGDREMWRTSIYYN